MSTDGIFKGALNVELTKLSGLKTEGIALANENAALEERRASRARTANTTLEGKIAKLEDDVEYYSDLLCKPMHEIAREHFKFRETYEAQQQLMADWMVSQKAFKELAIQFGKEKGMTPKEVFQKGMDMKIDVLENKHDQEHNTNAGTDQNIITTRKDILIKKYHESRRK